MKHYVWVYIFIVQITVGILFCIHLFETISGTLLLISKSHVHGIFHGFKCSFWWLYFLANPLFVFFKKFVLNTTIGVLECHFCWSLDFLVEWLASWFEGNITFAGFELIHFWWIYLWFRESFLLLISKVLIDVELCFLLASVFVSKHTLRRLCLLLIHFHLTFNILFHQYFITIFHFWRAQFANNNIFWITYKVIDWLII